MGKPLSIELFCRKLLREKKRKKTGTVWSDEWKRAHSEGIAEADIGAKKSQSIKKVVRCISRGPILISFVNNNKNKTKNTCIKHPGYLLIIV